MSTYASLAVCVRVASQGLYLNVQHVGIKDQHYSFVFNQMTGLSALQNTNYPNYPPSIRRKAGTNTVLDLTIWK